MPEAPTPRGVLVALLGLTVGAGMIDAASVLALDHVFTANMTGNIVFLGFALAGHPVTSIRASLVAVVAFLAGALIGGRFAAKASRARLPRGLGFGVVALAAAALLAAIGRAPATVPIVAALALAMGVRNAIIRKLGVTDLTTTVLTLTLAGLAADSSLAGGSNPRGGRRVLSVLVMLGGAIVGAWVLRFGVHATLGVATAIEAAATVLLIASARIR